MKQPPLNSSKLARDLKGRIRKQRLSYVDVAKIAKVDASRVSKICEGQFKRLSPVVKRVCDALAAKPETFLVNQSVPAPADLIADINRLISGNPDRARALQKILRIVVKISP